MSKKSDDLFKNVSRKNFSGNLESLTRIAKDKYTGETKRIAIKAPKKIADKFKSITASRGLKMQDVMNKMLFEYVEKNN